VSKEGREIKITDKRMFTPDGELREEYRFLEEKSTAAPAQSSAAAQPPTPGRSSRRAAAAREEPPAHDPTGQGGATAGGAGAAGATGDIARGDARAPAAAGARAEPAGRRGEPRVASSGLSGAPGDADEPSARLEFPSSPPGLGPSFYDLAALLAEPVALYLGDMELPDGQSAEDLEMARLYIDLLDVLRQKTAGNLTAQESAFLEDLLYRMRVRYVQKRG
jgi:hypothetical protein